MDQALMEGQLDQILLSEEEYKLGHEVWTTDKALFDDPFPEDFSKELNKKHVHIHSKDQDAQEGWQDCLDSDEDNGSEEEI